MAGTDPAAGGASAWERRLREVFGDQAPQIIAQMRAWGVDFDALDSDPAALMAAMPMVAAQMRTMMASDVGALDVELAHRVARHVCLSQGGDPSVTVGERRTATDAFRLAELWLDAVTDFPPTGLAPQVWSRSEWVEATMPAWVSLCQPVAEGVSAALATTLQERGAIPDAAAMLPPGMADSLGVAGIDPSALVKRFAAAVSGMQLGQAVGQLATEVFGVTDVAVPLTAPGTVAQLPRNVAEFADGLDVPSDDVRLHLTLREAASARLFSHASWLGPHVAHLVGRYARAVEVDPDAMAGALEGIDPTDASAVQQALAEGVFAPATTLEQREVLSQLETVLALVEGWLDDVVAQAALPHLTTTSALREMLARRRAEGGPAERAFAVLVGLELRPRRAREASRLFALLRAQRGAEGRDAIWNHPDLLPPAGALDDPASWVTVTSADSTTGSLFDEELAALLDQADGPDRTDPPDQDQSTD